MDRIQIPRDVSARILFESDRTCCVCRIRGKPVQVHHIDEDHSNNAPPNLAVLCFDCHRDTQITGGFDRKLDSYQVVLYRDDWVSRVRNRRAVDHGPQEIPPIEVGSKRPSMVNEPEREEAERRHESRPSSNAIDLGLIMSLAGRRQTAYRVAQPKWDSGITITMREGNGDVIEALLGVLTELARFYPADYFDSKPPRKYFEGQVRSLTEWHRKCLEPDGPETGGTIVQVIAGSQVISDLEKMVEDMVMSLTSFRDDFNYQEWRRSWTDGRA